MGWGGRGALGRDDELVQALLQSNARVDAADSDGCDPAREHRSRFHGCECLWVGVWRWKPTIVRLGVELPLWLGLMTIGAMGMGPRRVGGGQHSRVDQCCTCGEV